MTTAADHHPEKRVFSVVVAGCEGVDAARAGKPGPHRFTINEGAVAKLLYHAPIGTGDTHYVDVIYNDGCADRRFDLLSVEWDAKREPAADPAPTVAEHDHKWEWNGRVYVCKTCGDMKARAIDMLDETAGGQLAPEDELDDVTDKLLIERLQAENKLLQDALLKTAAPPPVQTSRVHEPPKA